MTLKQWMVCLALGAAAFAATGTAQARSSQARSSYDGLWSVLIITEQGTCDRGYRYALRIAQDRVTHADPSSSSFVVNGRVTGAGHIRVSVARGDQSANATGRLSRNAGTGRWRSSNGECSGIWTAERRG